MHDHMEATVEEAPDAVGEGAAEDPTTKIMIGQGPPAIPPTEWQAMTHEQQQAFLQAQATSRIQAITTALAGNVIAITGATQQHVTPQQSSHTGIPPMSVAAVSTGGGSSVHTPFGGRAAHGGRTG
jgi:hypothetical protein